jgi:hypothetical protein
MVRAALKYRRSTGYCPPAILRDRRFGAAPRRDGFSARISCFDVIVHVFLRAWQRATWLPGSWINNNLGADMSAVGRQPLFPFEISIGDELRSKRFR